VLFFLNFARFLFHGEESWHAFRSCAHILDLPIDAAEARSILGISEAGYCAATAFGFLPKSFNVGDRTVPEM
jgi:hypothetical protein